METESKSHKFMRYAYLPFLLVFITLMGGVIGIWYAFVPLLYHPLVILTTGIAYMIMRKISIRDQVDGFKLD